MRAAYIKAPFQIEFRDLPKPHPRRGDARLEVKLVGICGTDLHFAKGWATDWTRFGHEIVAIVDEIGPDVEDLKVGDVVSVRGTTMCGACRFCMAGEPAFCTGYDSTRLGIGMAEYLVAPRRSIWPVTGMTTRAASLIEPLAVAIDVVVTADVQLSDTVAIIGPGPIGIMAIRLARLRGARRVAVIGTSADVSRFDLCRDMGADLCINVEEEDSVAAIRQEIDPKGLDRIIVTAPPAALPSAISMGRYGAIVSFVGFAEDDADALVRLDINALHRGKTQLRFASSAPVAPFSISNELLAAGEFPVDRIVTHVLGFDQIDEALHLADQHADGVVKVLIEVSPE